MSTLVLTYFDLHGRAEPTRLALWIAGLNFEDKRLSREEFRAIKPDFPFGTVPVLEVGRRKYYRLAHETPREGVWSADFDVFADLCHTVFTSVVSFSLLGIGVT